MSAKYENIIPLISAQFDVNTAADKATLTIPFKCSVYRALLYVQGTDTGGCTVKFDSRATQNSDTGRGDGDVASIVVPAADNDGTVLYDDAGKGTVLNAGTEVVVQVTAESVTALNVTAVLLVDYTPETAANMSKLTETA